MVVSVQIYDGFREYLGDNTIDIDTDTITVDLFNSTHTFSGSDDDLAAITANQLATANGYTQNAEDLVTTTWNRATVTVTFDAVDPAWSASGGSIGPARHAVYFSQTSVTDKLMLNVNFGQDETAGDGTDFILALNASGIFTLT